MTITEAPPIGQAAISDSYISQLSDAQDFLDAYPDLPLSMALKVVIPVLVRTPGEVDRLAAEIGAAPAWNQRRTLYSAEHAHGPNVVTVIFYVSHDTEVAAA